MSHAHIASAHGFLDGQLTIDGERFPHPIYSIAYRLDNDHPLPRITVEFEVDHLTIDHSYEPATEPEDRP